MSTTIAVLVMFNVLGCVGQQGRDAPTGQADVSSQSSPAIDPPRRTIRLDRPGRATRPSSEPTAAGRPGRGSGGFAIPNAGRERGGSPSDRGNAPTKSGEGGSGAADPATPETLRVWPDRALGFQNDTPDPIALLEGDSTAAWFVSSHALGAGTGMSLETFITLPESEVRRSFERYLDRHPELHRSTSGYVVLDLEHPVSPVSLDAALRGVHPARQRTMIRSIAEAFALRTRVARSLLPNSRLLLYGVGTPHSQGRDTSIHLRNRRFAIQAARQGMLEGVDGICPVLYCRFTASEPAYGRRPAVIEQTVRDAAAILDAANHDRRPDMIPLLSLTIFNGGSMGHQQPAHLEDIQERLRLLHEQGFDQVIFWNADAYVRGTMSPVSDVFTALDREEDRLRAGEAN